MPFPVTSEMLREKKRFDPFAGGAAVEEGKAFDPFESGAAAPASSAVNDFIERMGQSGWRSTGDVVGYLGRLSKASADLLNTINEKTYETLTGRPLDPALRKARGLPETNAAFASSRSEADRDAEAVQRFGADLKEVGTLFTPDPARNNTAAATVAEVGGSLTPVVAAAPAGLPAMAVTLAGLSSEGVRAYALEQGDSEEVADAKARIAAAIGATTALTPQLPVRAGAGVLERVATRVAEGASVNAGQEAVTQQATEGQMDPARIKKAAAVGGGFGLIVAVPEAAAAAPDSARNIAPKGEPKAASLDARPAFDPFTDGAAEVITPSPVPAQEVATPEARPVPAADNFQDLTPELFTRRTEDGSFELGPDAQPVAEVATGPDMGSADSGVRLAQDTRSGAADVGKPAAKGKRFRLGARPDGVTDVLDALDQAGGVRPPSAVKQAGGEYDGFREAFGTGAPRLLVSKKAGAVDQVMQELEAQGFKYETPDDFYKAVQTAARERKVAVEAMRSEQDQASFDSAVLGNEGRRKSQTPAKPVNTDALNVGHTFKVRGEPFVVTAIHPDTGDVTVQDGPRYGTQVLPAGTDVFPDRATLRKPKAAAPAENQPFARRTPAAPEAGQADMFAGGETGGDTMFNLQGEQAKDFAGIVDQQAELAAAKKAQDQAQASLFRRERASSDVAAAVQYAQQTVEERGAISAELMARRAQWRTEAERIAPGMMSKFRLKFGDPELLVREGKVRPEELTGWEQAFYDGHERMLYLFDEALKSNADYFTRLNLLHEMGHAHWDTLPAKRQAELADVWRQEMGASSGPLHDGRKQLRKGVAQGIETDIKEWYAERVAWANHDWAKTRGAGGDVKIAGPIGRAAQEIRILLQQFKEWIQQLRGQTLDVDFRRFLDQGKRFEAAGEPAITMADGLATAAAQRDGSFARRAPGSAHSARNTADRMREAIDDIGGFLKRELTTRGHLPAAVFDARVARDGRVEAIGRAMQFALRDLDAGVRATYGGWSAVPAAEQIRINDVLGGRAPVSSLDPRLQPAVGAMRGHVDALSRRLVHEGVVDGDLAAKISGNVGFYLNRSYRKFDDPAWVRKVEPAVVNRAASFLRAELREDVLDAAADQAAAAAGVKGRGPQWDQIRQQLAQNQALQPDEANVQGLLEYLLTKDVAGAEALFQPGNGKDLSVVTKRKEIAPEIRELLGEYHDPRVNYSRSVAKMGQLLETHRFLSEAKAAGAGKFFFDRPQPGAAVRLAAEGSKALAPLDGLYTTPEIADAFRRVFDEKRPENPAWRAFLALNGWTKMAKTVLHPITQVRNFVANFGFLVANGHYHAADGGAAVLQAMKAELGSTDQRARDYLTRLARYNIVGESAAAGEVREALRDAGVKMTGIEQWTDSLAVRAAKLPLRAAERLYRVNDELFKIYAFENEVRHWREALPAAPLEQVERIAAERVLNTLPTYSRVPLGVQRIRRAALLGSFVSFPAEVVRTGYHTIRYAMSDLRSNNPSVRAMGARRLAGIAAAVAVYPAATAVSRWLSNVDEEDERDLRRFLPEWTRNSQLLYTSPNAGGRQSLVDLSYLDPWAYLRKPLMAAMHGEDAGDALGSAALEAMAPFFGEGVFAKVLLDIARNVDDRGRPVYDAQAGPIDRQLQKLEHAWTALEPGAVTQGKRMIRAARGEVTPSGRSYKLEDELLALTTGARSQSIDVSTAHHFQAGKFAGELNQATVTYRRVRDRTGATPEEIQAAKARFDQVRGKLFEDLHRDTASAQRLGIEPGQVLANLKAAGLSKAEIVTALTGQVFPYIERPVNKYETLRRYLEDQRN